MYIYNVLLNCCSVVLCCNALLSAFAPSGRCQNNTNSSFPYRAHTTQAPRSFSSCLRSKHLQINDNN